MDRAWNVHSRAHPSTCFKIQSSERNRFLLFVIQTLPIGSKLHVSPLPLLTIRASCATNLSFFVIDSTFMIVPLPAFADYLPAVSRGNGSGRRARRGCVEM